MSNSNNNRPICQYFCRTDVARQRLKISRFSGKTNRFKHWVLSVTVEG